MTDLATREGPILRPGIIPGPDGQAYRLEQALRPGDVIGTDILTPLGGAPKPVAGEKLPDWLHSFLFVSHD